MIMIINQNKHLKNRIPPLILLCAFGVMMIGGWYLSNIPQLYEGKETSKQAQISTMALAKGTTGLLKQTAIHLSKMAEGQSIGGFPGFEPPDDDEAYRRKIKEGNFSGQDVNDWVKEINNFLQQIIKKNPNMTLEQILQKAGLQADEIAHFISTLKEVHVLAQFYQDFGVNPTTLKILEGLMHQLGVVPWVL